ncbi:Por secretion system C-terminal sorting domain-containing protein [Algoriphagus locisalis]|uniref:Por secretion system C-terminal sorting domain-containing protein n=1 Tax=Algoriphagus locisalis TaxID=305507 RepID=A0A1I7DM69_9BACT|nr:S8 family serine peptidase [Algoriphagus locisalis]SFU12744.1 Por secretion system C-terminal sorting domain-containing protein [Algoriphagus locisalis]
MEKIKFLAFVLLGMLLSGSIAAQDRYAVFYKYKPQESLSLERPDEFLSAKALARRVKEGVAPDSLDLPVAQKYVDAVYEKSNYILYSSKWFNATLLVTDATQVKELEALPFVDRVELVGRGFIPSPNARVGKRIFASVTNRFCPPEAGSARVLTTNEETYDFQNNLLGIDIMHGEGFTGKGITIAVFDAGFPGAQTASSLAHLQTNGQIIATRDFVRPWNEDVYSDNQHGTNVLSLIASNEPGKLVAGAPDADYILSMTEEIATEYWVEEYNWVRAAEYADSLGTDIISSSVGYWDFDDPEMNYTLEELDGETTIIARGASIAASKGVLVVNSSGNYGPGESTLTSPSDAKGILAIGSVNKELNVANSSSRGPTGDGRIKPELAALGQGAALIRSDGSQGFSNGTSFSAPQITALAAGLWEAKPEWKKDQLIEALLNSGTQADEPDNILGYGIPNFFRAYYGEILAVEDNEETLAWSVYPNPVIGDQLNIYFGNSLHAEFTLIDLNGRALENETLNRASPKEPFQILLQGVKPGFYVIQMQDGALIKQSKLIRQ